MAMFLLSLDTSPMTCPSRRRSPTWDHGEQHQAAIALQAWSAAFILIGSKVGDLIGRKRVYIIGLLGSAVGPRR